MTSAKPRRDGSPAGGDARARRRILARRRPAHERDGHAVATDLGSFQLFVAVSASMMGAMMLPAAASAVSRAT
jgi:hypothetical protein